MERGRSQRIGRAGRLSALPTIPIITAAPTGRGGVADQYSSANIRVSTRLVTAGSAGSGEAMHRSRS